MPTAPPSKVDSIQGKLQSLRDELRVQLNLASKDARVALASFEPVLARLLSHVEDAGHALSGASEEARLQGSLALMEARERMQEVKGVLDGLKDEAHSDAYKAQKSLDVARLQMALARMEAADSVAARRATALKEVKRLGAEVSTEAERAVDAVASAFKELRRKLGG